ncbi:MAG TPA: Gfo/Idh/MocA family oxidoreductase [Bryobacteraceae bacterium]|nr:Gfo/Idh/MocA family oxidoreductase [Bryobacteraceae bacterium]
MEFTRRQFQRLAALGTVAGLTEGARAQLSTRKLGYCIVGLGRISMQHFMPATKTSQYAKVTAIVSGHRDKADRLAAEYGVPAKNIYSYDNYNGIAGNPDIDAVYIALPNSMHAEYTIRAAQAGKHVLCEKPMATSVADAQAMDDACRRANRKLMIAYRCHFEPSHLRARQLIRDGKLGKIQAIDSSFGFNIAAGEWRLSKKMAGGGPLMDVGIYCLNACRFLTGEEPVEIKGYPTVVDQDGRFREVEENVSWSMKFPSGAVASCTTTYGANMTSYFRVMGSKGEIVVEPAFPYDGQHLRAKIAGEPPIDEPSTMRDPGCFVLQADHFAESVFSNREPGPDGAEGIRDMKLIAAIYGV